MPGFTLRTSVLRRRRAGWLLAAGTMVVGSVLSVAAEAATPPAYAARASIAPALYYIGDSTGSVYTFTVKNTGASTSIGAVEIRRPTVAGWTVTSCPTAPAGWTKAASSTKCRYRSAATKADDIKPGTAATFAVKAKTAAGTTNRTGVWSVVVSSANHFDNPSLIKTAGATGAGLSTLLHTFELTTAVVGTGTPVAGTACPPANKDGVKNAAVTIVVCGKNRASAALTPKSAYSTLGGTFVTTPGTFVSGPVPANSGDVVLASWAGTQLPNAYGTDKKVIAGIGAASNRTSPLRTFTGYSVVSTPPTPAADVDTVAEEATLTVAAPGLLANDSDPDGDPLTATMASAPAHGTLAVNADGSYTYTGEADFHGTDTFTYTVNDGFSDSAPVTVTITVTPVPDAPVATDDTPTTSEDAATTVAVLGNDTDGDGDTLAVSAVDTTGTTGTVTNNGTNVTYDPNGQFEGLGTGQTASDTFTYTTSDGALTDTATVTVTITGVNDVPVALADAASTDEDTPVVVNVVANDTDDEGALTVTSVTGATNGTATNNDDGTVTFTPTADFHGTGSFDYTVTDVEGATDTATATITVGGVNDAPVATADSANVAEDSTGATIGVLGNDTDADGDTLTVTSVNTTGTTGTVTNNGTNVTYDPNGMFEHLGDDQTATDTFTYQASDGTATTSAVTVTVTILGDNDAPVAVDDAAATPEDTPVTLNVLANDTDDEGPLTVTSVGTATNGTATNNNDGTVTFTPAANFHGSASFGYTVTDAQGKTGTATVTITVGDVNDAPVAGDDAANVDEDSTGQSVPVRANDTDADADTLTVSAVDVTGTTGTVTNNGTDVTYDPNGMFEHLGTDQTATDTFTYTVSDGNGGTDTATVTVTILGSNDAPVAVADTATTNEDTPVTVSVLTNDTDAEGALTVTSVGNTTNGAAVNNNDGTVTFTPAANHAGSASFDYTVTDAQGATDTATVTITVTAVNDTPVANDDAPQVGEDSAGSTVAVLGNDTDADGDTLTVSAVDVTGTTGMVTNNGTDVTYDPNGMFEYLAAGETATDTFTYTVNDGHGGTDTATVTVTVNGANDAPVGNADAYNTLQDTVLNVSAPGVLTNDTDDDSSNTKTAGNASDPANGTVTLNADGSFAYTPDTGYTGTDTFTYDVSDGTATDSATVTITVIPPNAAPTADATSASGNEDGGAITVTLTGHDADGDALTFTAGTATNGLVTVPSGTSCDTTTPSTCTATVTYTPNANFNGTDSFTYSVNDGTVDSLTAAATVTVDAVNDAPSFTKGADQTKNEDAGAQTVNGWATGISAGPAEESTGQTVTFVVTTDNDGMFSTLPAVSPAGDLTYTPAPNANGVATVTVKVTDSAGGESATQTFVITVDPVNDAPSFTKGTDQTVNEDAGAQSVSNWAYPISKGPADESAQTLSFTTSNDNNGLFAVQPGVSPTGTLVFTPAANKYGTATVTTTLADSGGTENGGADTSAPQTFTITVNPVNDAPVAAAKSFTVQANMKITLSGLLTGATDPNDTAQEPGYTPVYTVGSITAGAGCVGCTVSAIDSANGTFDFEPPAGQTGTFTVTYTVVDSGHPAPGATSAAQTITFTVSGPIIWFADATSGNDTSGTGTLARPFATLGKVATVDAANQRIFLGGGTYTDPITLLNGEWLTGAGADATSFDALMGVTPPAGTIARPAVNATAPVVSGAVTLGSGNTVRGLRLSGNPALSGTSFGTLTTGSEETSDADVTLNTTGQAVSLSGGTIAGDFAATTSTGGTNNVQLSTVATTGTTSFGTGALSGATSEGIRINGGSGSFTFPGTFSHASTAPGVSVSSKTGGTVSFPNTVNDTSGAGVSLASNTGSVMTFSGGVTLSSGTSPAFAATGGGTVTVTGAGNTLTSTTGTPLAITDTAIGSGNVTFQSIAANGAARGIHLSNTGSTGRLVVTGTGGTCTLASTAGCSGGTLANLTGADDSSATPAGTGIVLNNTVAPSITRMRVNGSSNYGIRGNSVAGLTLDSVVVDGTNGTNANAPFDDSSMLFNQSSGTLTFTNVQVTGGHSNNIAIINTSGAVTANFSGLRVGHNSTTGGNDGLLVEGTGTSTVNATVNGASTFTGARGDTFNYIANGSGGGTLSFTGNTLTNSHPAIATGGGGVTLIGGAAGPVSMTFSSNTMRDAVGNAVTISKTSGAGSITGTFANNVIGVSGVANSGSLEGAGVSITHQGTNTNAWTITGNQIRQYNNAGIYVQSGDGATSTGIHHAVISGNTVAEPGNNPNVGTIWQGVLINSGTSVGETFTTCADFGPNTVVGSGRNGGVDVRVRHRQDTTVKLPGYTGTPYDTTAATTHVTNRFGSPAPAVSVASSSTGGGFVGGASC